MVEYVYAMTAEGRPGCKVGFSKSPKARLQSVSRDIKMRCDLRAAVACVGTWGWLVERDVHRALADRRIKNEWFDTCPSEVRSIAKRFAKFRRLERARILTEDRLKNQFYAAEKAVYDHRPTLVSAYVSPEVWSRWEKLAGNRDAEKMVSAVIMKLAAEPHLLAALGLASDDEVDFENSCEHRLPDLWKKMEARRAVLEAAEIEFSPVKGLR